MTESQIIAEIQDSFEQYYSEGLISTVTIVNEVENALKEFGNDVMVKKEDVVVIDNYKADTPKGLWAIDSVRLIEPDFYKYDKETIQFDAIDGVFKPWRKVCDNMCDMTCKAKYEYQKRFPWGILTIGYNNTPREMEVNPIPFVFNPLHQKYENFNCNEVCLSRGKIQTRLKDGLLYIKYRSLPLTDEGEYYIPESDSGSLADYVLNRVSAKVLFRLIASGKAPNSIELLSYFKNEERVSHIKASADLKMKSMTDMVIRSQGKINNGLRNIFR